MPKAEPIFLTYTMFKKGKTFMILSADTFTCMNCFESWSAKKIRNIKKI